MPVVEGQVFLQVALVFGLIGLLGLVLRWTFRRDAEPRAGYRPEEAYRTAEPGRLDAGSPTMSISPSATPEPVAPRADDPPESTTWGDRNHRATGDPATGDRATGDQPKVQPAKGERANGTDGTTGTSKKRRAARADEQPAGDAETSAASQKGTTEGDAKASSATESEGRTADGQAGKGAHGTKDAAKDAKDTKNAAKNAAQDAAPAKRDRDAGTKDAGTKDASRDATKDVTRDATNDGTKDAGKDGDDGAAARERERAAEDRAARERAARTAAMDAAQVQATPTAGDREDYGLLAVAATVDTEDELATVRRALTAAGIRNTNAVAPDGRHKVLVFGSDLIKARRVAGGSPGGNPSGSGGS